MSANSLWYLGLAVSSAALLIYIYLKTRNMRIMLLFTAMVGLVSIIESVIFIFLGSDQHDPQLLQNHPYFDNVSGAIALRVLPFAVITACLPALSLSWLWILFFTGALAGIEWLFLKLHIYSHNWWRLWFTAFGLPVYFAYARWLYRRMYRPLRGYAHRLLLFLITAALSETLGLGPIMLFSNRRYVPGWFPETDHDTMAFASVYGLCISLFLIWVVTRRWKRLTTQFLFALSCLIGVDMVLKAVGIQRSLAWWDEAYFILSHIGLLMITQTASDYLSKDPPIWKR
ncbi:hypothetical protein [Paenibacillus nasutitermitis]|uniref:Uncharacterized protein n=1 Tax=Paenibacillus nasutitermitis TaxID=1652958 RepID=A0A917DQM0_9BACL|nr:hypothetical protein [Paenibacillus nasutitermitis]GGD57405.1 hypothetical protein GCM10010911_14020 [Paenibacillus nasutitermitis]